MKNLKTRMSMCNLFFNTFFPHIPNGSSPTFLGGRAQPNVKQPKLEAKTKQKPRTRKTVCRKKKKKKHYGKMLITQ